MAQPFSLTAVPTLNIFSDRRSVNGQLISKLLFIEKIFSLKLVDKSVEYKCFDWADGSVVSAPMRPINTVRNNETLLHRHRSTQFIHNLSSCLSLAMSNRLSSRRPNVWSESFPNRYPSRAPLSSQSRTTLQSLSPFLNSSDTYICCSYSPRCFIIQKVSNVLLLLTFHSLWYHFKAII